MYREVLYSHNNDIDQPVLEVKIPGASTRIDLNTAESHDQAGFIEDIFWKARGHVIEIRQGSNGAFLEFPGMIKPKISCYKRDDDIYLWVATNEGTITRISFDNVRTLTDEWNSRYSSYILRSQANDPLTYITSINEASCLVGLKSGKILRLTFLEYQGNQMYSCEETELFATTMYGWFANILAKKQTRAKIKALATIEPDYIVSLGKDAYVRVYSSITGKEVARLDLTESNPTEQVLSHIKYSFKPLTIVSKTRSVYYVVVYMYDKKKKLGQFISLKLEFDTNHQNEQIQTRLSFDIRSKVAPHYDLADYLLVEGNIWGVWRMPDHRYIICTGKLLRDAVKPHGLEAFSPQPSWIYVRTLYDDVCEITNLGATELQPHVQEYLDKQLDLAEHVPLQDYLIKWLSQNFPIGLIQTNTFIGVVRKEGLAVIRVGEVLECAVAPKFEQKWGTFQYFRGRDDKKEQITDMLHLTTALRTLRQKVPLTQYLEFIATLPLSQTNGILENAHALIEHIGSKWEPQVRGVNFLIELLENVDYNFGTSAQTLSNLKDKDLISEIPPLFVANTLSQIVHNRLELAIDLLLYLLTTHNITLADKVAELVRMYGVFDWLKDEYVYPDPRESEIMRLAKLDLNDKSNSYPSFKHGGLLFELLFEEYRQKYRYGESLMELSYRNNASISLASLSNIVVFLAMQTLSYIWSIRDEQKKNALDFAHILHINKQYRILQWYCSILVSDIPWLHHFLGFCYLNYGHNPNKARDHFILCGINMSVEIVDQEPFLFAEKIFEYMQNAKTDTDTLQESRKMMIKAPTFHYYNSLRLYMENHPDLVIEFVNLALSEIPDEYEFPEETFILWSVLFSYSLMFERYDDAYVAIVSNMDEQRCKTDLRRFICYICEKGLFEVLNELPYQSFTQEVATTLSELAANVDVNGPVRYYDALFIFHTYRGNYSSAAQAMWECGQRIERESHGNLVEAIERSARCYLSAINSLKLLPETERYIVILPSKSKPKRNRKSEIIQQEQPKTKFITIDDIEGDYLRTVGLLNLANIGSATMFSRNPADMVTLLAEGRVFDIGFSIAVRHKLPLNVLFTELTYECVEHQLQPDQANKIILDEELTLYGDNVGLHFQSTSDRMWNLLKYYLHKYDDVRIEPTELLKRIETKDIALSTLISDAVRQVITFNDDAQQFISMLNRLGIYTINDLKDLSTHQQQKLDDECKKLSADTSGGFYGTLCVGVILERGMSVPYWLDEFCQKRNVDALIRVYMKYDLLEECVKICLKHNDISLTMVDLLLVKLKTINGAVNEHAGQLTDQLQNAIRDKQAPVRDILNGQDDAKAVAAISDHLRQDPYDFITSKNNLEKVKYKLQQVSEENGEIGRQAKQGLLLLSKINH